MILVILPLLALALSILLLQLKFQDWRHSILSGLIVWGVLVTIVTESLSLFAWLYPLTVAFFWFLIDVFLASIYYKFSRPKFSFSFKKLLELPPTALVLLLGVGVIILTTGFLAIIVPPNNSDSMVYHLSRVVHWLQNHSIAHYPTHTLKQLYLNPWSEFAMMNLQILSGTDRLANLIQWGSMLGSLIGVSLIAKQLGANLRGQVLAVVFCATIPMGILQASTTQNDYVVALWLIGFAYFTLLTVQQGINPVNTLLLGASLGLAILTKGTAYFYAFPFCLWLAWWGIKTLKWQVWKPILVTLGIALAINLGHYLRNLLLFSSIFGASAEAETTDKLSLVILLINIVRQLSLHVDIVRNLGLENWITPTTGIANKIVQILHGFAGIDINDRALLSPKVPKFYVPAVSTYEDTCSNPFHLLLIFLSLVLLVINPKVRKEKNLISYTVAVVAGFLLLCSLLTWSPWRVRLHLPFFVLSSAYFAVIFSKSFNYRIVNILAVLLIVLSYPWVFQNSLKSLVKEEKRTNVFSKPPIEQYFATQAEFQKPYIEVSKIVHQQNCSNIGLMGDRISYEYPLWVLLKQSQPSVVIKHIDVTNESGKINSEDFKPCAIISVDYNLNKSVETEKVIGSQVYQQYWSGDWSTKEGKVTLFLPLLRSSD